MDLISNQQILMRLFLFSKRFLTLSYPNLMRSATHAHQGGGFSLIVLGFFIAYNFVITIFLLTFAG